MSTPAAEFIDAFVIPLLSGGPLVVGAPVRLGERDEMAQDAAQLRRSDLQFCRLRRAQRWVPNPILPDPGHEELTLWVGLHNALVFDHPDRRRVWARSATWRRLEGATRTMLTLPATRAMSEGLARHVSVGAFIELVRRDTVVATASGELRFLGQQVPRRRLRLSAVPQTGHRDELVRWLDAPHAPETERLIEDAMRASPLTCLMHPRLAPPGFSPLLAAEFLRDRSFARAVVYAWARSEQWVAVGAAVTAALLPSLPQPVADAAANAAAPAGPLALPGVVVPTSPEVLSAVVGALIHLHFLKVVELQARLSALASNRDRGTEAFLALPLVLPHLASVTGVPLPGLAGRGVAAAPATTRAGRRGGTAAAVPAATVSRRWTEYLDHLAELVPKRAVDNLLAALVPRIVQTP